MQIALELPVLPAAHARVLSILGQQVASISEIVQVVESDPALTASVLRTANSAASAPVTRINTANNAIIRIGLSMTRRILTGAVLKETFRSLEQSRIDVDELWRHLLSTALLAETEAPDATERTAAFTAGLLHDVGRLAMATSAPEQYRGVLGRVANGESAAAAERAIFGVDHMEWGVEVGRAWEFPTDIIEAIALHHEGGPPLAERTRRAREAADRLGTGDGLIPAHDALEGDLELTTMLAAFGGRTGFERRVAWYHGALLVG